MLHPCFQSIDVEEFRLPLPGHSWRPECYFPGAGWGGIATNANCSLLAVAEADDTISIYDISKGLPTAAAADAGCNSALAVIRDVHGPRAICFAGERVLVADAGNHRIGEFTTEGVLVRSIAVWENSWIHGIAWSGKLIAVTFIQALQVYLVDYASGEVMHRINTGTPPAGVRFSADGTYVVWMEYYSNRIGRCRVDTGENVECLDLGPRACFNVDVLLCEEGKEDFGDSGDFVLAPSYPFFLTSSDNCPLGLDGPMRSILTAPLKADEDGCREERVQKRVAGRVTGLAWCNTGICYKLHDDPTVHSIPSSWFISSRCAWISAAVTP
jgi:hypothetical protein